MSKFYPIGTMVNYEGVNLLVKGQVANKPSCARCFFNKDSRKREGLKVISCYIHGLMCTAAMRKDNRHVVFIKVK